MAKRRGPQRRKRPIDMDQISRIRKAILNWQDQTGITQKEIAPLRIWWPMLSSAIRTPERQRGMKMSEREVLSEVEAAELLGLKDQTLRMWRSERKGPPFLKLGRTVRYRRSTLMRWLDEQEIDPAEVA